MATQYLEDLIYSFLRKHLSRKEKLELHSGYDAERHIDEETEDEMMNELFRYVKRNVVWSKIIRKLHDEAHEDDVGSTMDSDGSSPDGEEDD